MGRFARLIPLLAAAVLLACLGCGCTVKARQARTMARADRDFAAGRYDAAEGEYMDALRLDSKDPKPWAQLGTLYFNESRTITALSFLREVRRLTPNNTAARVKLASVYLGFGDAKDARDEAAFAFERNPLDPDAPLVLAESLTNANDMRTFHDRFQSALAQTPAGKRAPLLTAMGLLSLEQRDGRAGEKAFKDATADDPKFSPAYSGLAVLYGSRKDNTGAEENYKKAAEFGDPWSNMLIQYAQFKVRKGDVDDARKMLEAKVKQNPEFDAGWLALANVNVVQKRADDAISCLGTVLNRDPDNFEALMLDGQLRQNKNDLARAVADFDRAATKYGAPKAYYELASAYMAQDDTGKAVAALNRCLTLSPNMGDALLLLAQIRLRTGDTASAVYVLEQLTVKQPSMMPAQLLLARLFAEQDNYQAALRIYGRLVELYPTNAEPYYLTGTLYMAQKKPDMARKAYQRAIQVDPTYLPALEQLTDMDIGTEQFGAALERLQKLIKEGKPSPGPEILVAKVLEAGRENERARSVLTATIEAWPDYTPAYLVLAQLYAASGENQRALTNLAEALIKSPTNESAIMLSAVIHHQQKEYTAARDGYEKLLKIDPKNSAALNNLAYLDSEQFNMQDKALELARRARELLPDDPYTADTYGWVIYRRHDYARAIGPLQQSADQISTEPDVQFHVGMAYYMMGEEERARAALNRAVQLGKPFDGKDEAADRLRMLAVDPKTAGPEVRTDLEKETAKRTDPIALDRLGAIYERDGATEKAATTYESALNLNTNNARVMLDLVRLYSGPVKNFSRALALARSADRIEPDNPVVDHVLGRAFYLTSDYRKAEGRLKRAVDARPGEAEWQMDYAEAAYAEGHVPDARKALESAVRPGASGAFPRAGEAKQMLDMLVLTANPAQATAAVPRLEQTLKTNADDMPALAALAAAHDGQTNLTASAGEYTRILEHYPDFSPAARRLAIIYSADPDNAPKTAYELAVKAHDAFPDDPAIGKALGMLVYSRQEYLRAARLLKESAAKLDTDASLMYYLGMAQYQSKDNSGAKKSLQRAIELKLPDKFSAEAQKVLKQLK